MAGEDLWTLYSTVTCCKRGFSNLLVDLSGDA